MGSLMPGWDSPVSHHITELEKNKSMTNEDIEAYWRSVKEAEDEQDKSCQESLFEANENIERTEDQLEKPTETSLEKLMKENGWWALTNSAFLNDPPVIAVEGPIQNYVSQFHVANKKATIDPH